MNRSMRNKVKASVPQRRALIAPAPVASRHRRKLVLPPEPKTVKVLDVVGESEVPNPAYKPTKLRRGFAVMSQKQRSAIAALGGKSHSREHLARIGALGGAAKGVSAAQKCAVEKRPSYTASKRKDSSQ